MSSIAKRKETSRQTLPVGVPLWRGLVAEVGHSVVLGSEGLEPGLEAELLLVAGHQHAAQPELVLGHRRLGHGGHTGAGSEAPGIDSLVSSPLQHDFNVT